MTSFFEKKVSEVADYDTHVIVDNFVETGDFSSCFGFLDKKYSMFFSKKLQEKISKNEKNLLGQ